MCGRFNLTTPAVRLIELFSLMRAVEQSARYNIAPTQPAACVRELDGHRQLDLLRWGLLPVWAKSAAEGSRMINARSETITEKRAFSKAFAERRCLVPADGFYEWKREGRERQPLLIRHADQSILALAGLWSAWKDPQTGSTIDTFTILTTSANGLLQQFHDRMPVILPRDCWAVWLNASTLIAELTALLRPLPPDLLW